jgi:NAD(P)H-hydrate epimerase
MPVWVVGASESAERDRAAIERGTLSRVLMQRAGTTAAAEIARRFPERVRSGVTVFTGPGNNGGDGWVVAGSLARDGAEVRVVEAATASAEKSPDAFAMRASALDMVDVSESAAADSAIVVDALLGTGFAGEPRGQISAAIGTINSLRAKGAVIAALDLPSGLDATTGAHTSCVVADLTVSFGGMKRGTLLARDCCGTIVVVDIGLDSGPEPRANDEIAGALPLLVDGEWVRSRVPPIRYDAHKGTRKHLAIVGGGPGMPGAVVLATRGALRSGIGLVRALVHRDNVAPVLSAVPSALLSEWPATADKVRTEITDWADAIVIGPGLGKSDESKALVERILRDGSRVPVLLDADALNMFEGDANSLGDLLNGRAALITPHAAEFARLAGTDVQNVLTNRFDIGLDLARAAGAAVLLKGSPTIISTGHGTRFVVARGTAALGTGGSGDLLDGIAGTILAQTGDPVAAAAAGAWMHGRAAELCEYVRGITLEDVLYALPRAWNEPECPPAPPVLAELPAVAR